MPTNRNPKHNLLYPVPLPPGSGLAVPVSFPTLTPDRGLYEAAVATASFLNNFRRMRRANWVDADKYYHCKANARSAQLGPHGRAVAKIISEGREISDRFKYKYIRKEKNDAELDQEANHFGRQAGSLYPRADLSAVRGELCAGFRPPNFPKRLW